MRRLRFQTPTACRQHSNVPEMDVSALAHVFHGVPAAHSKSFTESVDCPR